MLLPYVRPYQSLSHILQQLTAASSPAFSQLTASCTTDASLSIPRPSLPEKAAEKAQQAKEKAQQAKARIKEGVARFKEGARETRDHLRASIMSQVPTAQAVPETGSPTTPVHHVAGAGCSTRGARFQNPWPATWEDKSLMDVWTWQRSRSKLGVNLNGWLEGIPFPKAADFARAFPLQPVDWAAVAQPPEDAIQAVWVGHATTFVQMGGLNFITDPCLSERCSPSQMFGPKRVVAPAFEAEDPRLNKLDFVLLSHNHYDHLDHGSVMRLYKRFGDALTWYVPLGVKAWFEGCGIKNVIELDWWQDVQHGETKTHITFVPAQHWSARGILDRRNTLWGGYVVKSTSPDLTYFFAGDSGYCEVFEEIGRRLGPMDLSSIPIGAYEPRWFLRPQHVNPEEGFQIHRDVGSKRSMAIHCCTWSLTDEALDEPPRRLAEAVAAAGGDPHEFVTIAHGAMIQVKEGRTLNNPVLLTPAVDAVPPQQPAPEPVQQ